MKRRLLLFMFLQWALCLFAVPSLPGIYTYIQPDGSTFRARLSGDEWSRMLTTLDGEALCMDAGGWYCYAAFSDDGSISPTKYHFGDDAPAELKAASKRIPSERIRERARSAREARDAGNRMTKSASVRSGEALLRRVLVIPAEFQDLKFTYGREFFDDMLNMPGYSNSGANGSALDYFNDQFRGEWEFEFVVSQAVTLPRDFAYYGTNDQNGYDSRANELIIDACALADEEIDFSSFDTLDGDGTVDIVVVFVAGGDEAQGESANHIWSHQSSVFCADRFDGMELGRYLVTTELWGNQHRGYRFAPIGTFCHELSHSFGLPDLYDTAQGSSAMFRLMDLMDSGSYNNDGNTPPNYSAVEWDCLGMGNPMPLMQGFTSLPAISSGTRDYYVQEGSTSGDYFIIECRSGQGWDRWTGGKGLVCYHIDRSSKYQIRWAANEVNINPDHRCVDVLSSHPGADHTKETMAYTAFFPNDRVDAINADANSAYMHWNGELPRFKLADISFDESSETIRFNAVSRMEFISKDVFQDAAILLWACPSSDFCRISVSHGSEEVLSGEVLPYADGQYSFTLEHLEPNVKYSVSVSVGEGEDSETISTSFSTSRYYRDAYPFIYLASASRGKGGEFERGERLPLRVFNAPGAVSVMWFLDAERINPSPDGYWDIREGVLMAEVHYDDGRVERIRKVLKVK